MRYIVVIAGPTASNKSRIAIEVALRLNGEIVNADSRQFFKYMRIGTASPTDEEKRIVPHHLYNIFDPSYKVNAGLFVRMADETIEEICQRGSLPIIVGGTGLYLKALLYGIAEIPDIPSEVRKKVRDTIDTKGLEYCYGILSSIDPQYSQKISPSDRQRIERALEVYYATGERFSEFHKRHRFREKRYNDISIKIMPPRESLYKRINERTRLIFNSGIIEEARYLIENGYIDSFALDAIGYEEAYKYITNKISLTEAIEETAKRTRNYAKRQMTWFKRFEGVEFKSIDDIENIIQIVKNSITKVCLE